MAAALLLVDVVKDFLHEDGHRLLASYRERHSALVRALEQTRAEGRAVVYANDAAGVWDSDAPRLVRRAIEEGKAGELVAAVAVEAGACATVDVENERLALDYLERVLGVDVRR